MNKKMEVVITTIILFLVLFLPGKQCTGTSFAVGDTSVSIIKPYGYVYVFDRAIAPLPSSHMPFKAIVIGEVTVIVNATGVDVVKFYVDNKLKYNDTAPPYEWLWNEKLHPPPIHTLKVVGYGAGATATDEIKVLYVNPFKHR